MIKDKNSDFAINLQGEFGLTGDNIKIFTSDNILRINWCFWGDISKK